MFSLRGFARRLGAFGRDVRGVIALKFALIVPAAAVLGLGAVDLYAVYSDKRHLSEIADAAALAGARELGLATEDNGPEGRARAYVDGLLSDWSGHPEIQTTAEVLDLEDGSRALRVRLDGHRMSFFGNMLPPGGWAMAAEATATSVAITPLCVLAHGDGTNNIIRLDGPSQIRAPACMVHSNGDIRVEGGHLSAAAVQAVGPTRGTITPTAVTGAERIEDPFRDADLERLLLRDILRCTVGVVPTRITTGRLRLQPGLHCNGYDIGGDAVLELAPGEHRFLLGPLILRDNASLTGEDVVLMFGRTSRIEFRDNARVSLDGRRTGAFAGIVLATTRENTQTFTISSNHVESLLGVIYIPSATLQIEGDSDVARESAWTVIVAKALRLSGSPQLFINADYDASNVPVPDGVGPQTGGSHLID